MPLHCKFTAWEEQHVSDYIGCLRKLHYENKQKSCFGLLEIQQLSKQTHAHLNSVCAKLFAKAAWPCTAYTVHNVKAQTIPPLETPSLLRCYYVLYPEDGGNIVFRNVSTPCNIPEDLDLHRRHRDKLKSRNSSSFPT